MTPTQHPREHSPIRFARILFAADFSAVSGTALPFALGMARRFGSMLYLVHVIPPESYAEIPESEREPALAQMRQEAEERIAALLVATPLKDVPHKILVLDGGIPAVLSVVVEEHDIDLIVTGTHGRRGIQKLLSGSVAEEISRMAMCPVLLIGPEVSLPPEAEAHLERILHLTDFSPESERARQYSFALAKKYSAHLYFLNAVEDVEAEPRPTKMPADSYFYMRLLERGWPPAEDGIQPKFLVEFGSPEDVTLQAAAKHHIQLIVLSVPGTAHPDLTAHLPGPLAYDIASRAPCPVLAVRGISEG